MLRALTILAGLMTAALAVWALSLPPAHHPPADEVVAARLARAAQPRLQPALAAAIAAGDAEAAAEMLLLAERLDLPVAPALRERARALADNSWRRAASRTVAFLHGFATGDGDSAAGFAGAVAADLTVVGDLRDGGAQLGHWLRGEPVDEVVLALSGGGIVLSAATVASGGGALPARAAWSLVKMSARQGGRLTRQLVLAAGRGADVRPALRQVAVLARAASPAGAVRVLRHVDTAADLSRAQRLAARYGAATPGLFRLLGRKALDALLPVARLSARAVKALWCAALSFATFLAGLIAAALPRVVPRRSKQRRKRSCPRTWPRPTRT